MKKNILVAMTVLVLATLVGFIVFSETHQPAPAFSLKSLQGKTIDNNQLQGKVTLLNFWFPSCPGCVSEMPKLIQMAHDYKDKNMQIIGIAVPIDPLSSVENYVAQYKLPFDVAFDADKSVTKSFVKTELYPTSVLINQRGEILRTFVGEPNFQKLYQEVDAELPK